MSRKLYKLNEIDNHIDCHAQVIGKLTFAINDNSGQPVDVYDGTELYSENHGKKFPGKYLWGETRFDGRIITIEYSDLSTVMCFCQSGEIVYYDGIQEIQSTKEIDRRSYLTITRDKKKCNIFDIDGKQCLKEWGRYADVFTPDLFWEEINNKQMFLNSKGEVVLENASVDSLGPSLQINYDEEFICVQRVDPKRNAYVLNLLTRNGKLLLPEWATKDIKGFSVDTKEGKLCETSKRTTFICSQFQNPNKVGKLFYKIYRYDKKKNEAISVTDDVITTIDRKYVANKDIVLAWNDTQKVNILSPDGFVFDHFIDQVYIQHIGINLEEWQEDFIKSGLIVCENDGKYNLVENSTDVKMFDSFVDNVIKQENIFNDYQPLILIKYADNTCDIASISDLKPEFNASLSDILENSDGFIFFTIGKNKYLYMGEDKYVECENCINSYYGICIKKEYGYMFEFNGKFSSTYDNVYDIDSLFPIVEIDGKYNFFDWAICKVCFNEWFDDVEPYDAKYMKGTMDSGERGYNRKGGHEFTVYKNGKREQVGYFPDKNFGIA